jgi:hypothetical protein
VAAPPRKVRARRPWRGRARHVGWHGRASPHDHFGWAAVASCQASCAVALGQYLPNTVHTFQILNFVIPLIILEISSNFQNS